MSESFDDESPTPSTVNYKNFAFIASGSKGDVVPLIWLAKQLRGLGHEITFMANPYYEKDIAKAFGLKLTEGGEETLPDPGVRFVPVGTAGEFIRSQSDAGTWDAKTAEKKAQEGLNREQYEFHKAVLGLNKKIDAFVHNPLGIAAPSLAARYDVKNFPVFLAPQGFWFSSKDFPVHFEPLARLKAWIKFAPKFVMKILSKAWTKGHLKLVNEFRQKINEVDAPGMKAKAPMAKDFYDDVWTAGNPMLFFPEWYAPLQKDWLPEGRPVGQFDFPMQDAPTTDIPHPQLSKFLAKCGEHKPIFWTAGSTNMSAGEEVKKASETSELLKRPVLLVGPHFPVMGHSVAPHVFAIREVPLSSVLPRCAVAVHHGGVGTMAACLKAGIPQVMAPKMGDQFDNADRAAKKGFAASLKLASRAPEDYAKAILGCLDDGLMKESIKKYSSLLLDCAKGLGVAEWIERRMENPR